MDLNTMRRPLLAALGAGALSFAAVAGTADRVRADFKDYAGRTLVHYALPPMSESQRLPDAYPEDGRAGATVRIRAAKGEYEPGAFGVWATRDLGKVRFEIGEFKRDRGSGIGDQGVVVFPKENLDLALVKCWYQNLNGWFSYFSDNGFKLVPELLLHNEELIRCDDAKKANYARIVGPDGKTTERWLNPPQKMDRLVSPNLPWRTREPFQPMRPGFHDADKLQPVALPKEEFRCFFLTAHVTKDIPAGLYKGVVKVKSKSEKGKSAEVLALVPVEIEVLDFELPAPKSYHEPQTDFLVSFYSYDGLGNICEYNGGDRELARRQLKAILENQVAHGQSVHMMGGNLSGEVLDTVKKMVEAGMRPDVIQGGVSPSTKHGLTHAQTAEIIRAECDRRFGHHNVYMAHGDEPGIGWLLRERPVLHAYVAAGLKFYIAGPDSVYYKDGHLFDWHNVAQDPVKGFSTPLWNALGESYVAWYAQQHVGAENPALNRRQNGMGAYLSGYTALCNYAHHLGEYDDDRDMYRPMVFAYGTDNGVIDTIQWEGFREGIDDIRYATLLTQLAHRARKSAVPAARQLGTKALQYLAMFDRGAGDLDTCRAEMTHYIQGLLAYEKPDPVRPVARPQSKPADADRLFAEETTPLYAKLAAAKTVAATNACVRELQVACRKHFRYEELLAISEKYDEPYGVIEAAEQLFDDAKADAWRMRAYRTGRLPSQHAIVPFLGELMSRHSNIENEPAFAAALYRGRDTNALVRTFWSDIGKQGGWMRDAFFPVWKRFYAINAAMADRVGEKGMSAEAAKLGVEACVATGDWPLLQMVVARARANEKLKPSDRYTLELAAAILKQDVLRQGAPDVAALLKAVDVTDVVPEDRAKAIQQVGAWAMLANGESLVRGLEACRKGLYRPAPKKQYRVRHSSVPVEGPAAWDRLDVVPETAVYDRQFGGSTEAFATDVTTGTRSTGSAKETLEPTRMQIVTDDWGLHFRFESPDPKAREVESELVSGGSFEMYLSPGKNKPYMTMSITPGRDVMSVFNTQYETFGHRRLLGERPETYRLTTTFGVSNIVVGLSIPWEAYAADVPVKDAVWDFENLYWHRAGNCAWNGTDTIHGRSTWGELVFEMPEAARVRILRRLGRKACLSFLREVNRRSGYEGCVMHWEDDEVGDPAFHAACLKDYVAGLVEKADAFRKDPTDKIVRTYDADGTIARWRDIFFEVSRRRAEWLNRGVGGGDK